MSRLVSRFNVPGQVAIRDLQVRSA